VRVNGNDISIGTTELDPQELRFALLFWDKLAWPTNNLIHIRSGPEAQFLEDVAVLTRPRVVVAGSGVMAQGFVKAHIAAFLKLDKENPGCWALAQGERSLLLQDTHFSDGRGLMVELHRAIPVPDKDVPLADILEFRSKRKDELVRLRSAIDDFYSELLKSADPSFDIERRKADRKSLQRCNQGRERDRKGIQACRLESLFLI